MSEDRTKIAFTLPADAADEAPALAVVEPCLADLAPQHPFDVVLSGRTVRLTIAWVALQESALAKLLSELAGFGSPDAHARVWNDATGEATVYGLVDGELLSFDSLEALDRSANDAAAETMPDTRLQKLIEDAPSWLAIRFARPEKPLAKHLARVRGKVRALFEEATIEASGSSWADGIATVVYRGHIDTDVLPLMVRDNELVADLFEILGGFGAADIRMTLHHEALRADCHAFVEQGELVCRFLHRGQYVRGFVAPSTDGIVRGGEEATDPDTQTFDRLFDRLNDGLELVHASEGKTIDECTESLLSLSRSQRFAVFPRLVRIGVENALVVIDFDQGKAIGITFPQKAMATEWIARRIHDHREGVFASGDYGLYDAVADRFYLLQEDVTWIEPVDARE